MTAPTANCLLIRRAGPITFLLTALIGIGIWLLFRPGIMSYDSIDQYGQARSGQFTSWHPPVLVATLSLAMRMGYSIGSLMLVQCLVGILGIRQALISTMLLASGQRTPRTYWAAFGLLLLILSPLTPTAFYLMTFWKDCWTAFLLLWAVALALQLLVEAPQLPGAKLVPRLVVLLAVMTLAALPRHNALVVTPALGLLLWGVVSRRGVRHAWPLVAAPLVLAVLVEAGLEQHLHVQKTYPGNHVKVLDLLGICVLYPEEKAGFPYISANMREGIDRYYRFGDISPIAFEHPEIIDPQLLRGTYHPELDAEYRRALLTRPLKLLHVKYLAFSKLLDPANSRLYYFHSTLNDNPYGLQMDEGSRSVREWYTWATMATPQLPLARWVSFQGLWFDISLVLLAVFGWRGLRHRKAPDLYLAGVLLVPACYVLGYMLATIAMDYRYLYPSTLLMQVLAGGMAFSRLFPPSPRRSSVPSASEVTEESQVRLQCT